jgi:hypothetical protein
MKIRKGPTPVHITMNEEEFKTLHTFLHYVESLYEECCLDALVIGDDEREVIDQIAKGVKTNEN